ncbi:MAG TPA: hypothetical protein VH207_01940 [Chthoniobacterales bacterium]|jgi:hypothetical protein|nr:hypothetical protein [Chthoniobacterales bacterium]
MSLIPGRSIQLSVFSFLKVLPRRFRIASHLLASSRRAAPLAITPVLARKTERASPSPRGSKLLKLTPFLPGDRILRRDRRVGGREKDLACEYLAKSISLSASSTNSYGALKLLPYWDPLRGDPRFEKIVASLAPMTSAKK